MRRLGTGVATLLACAACGEGEAFHARFAVRGRWPAAPRVAYRIEAADGPLAAVEFHAALQWAFEAWSATGCASFQAADAGEAAVLFAWRHGAHDACPAFGSDPAFAHTGPLGPDSFVHFDAGRAWTPSTLRGVALHEVGHVLGLDHSPDERDAMFPEPTADERRLARGDLAGLHSLYGGGEDSSADLVIRGEGTLRLRAVAPPELTDWDLFDADGDGRDELLVWRTDRAGAGALWLYFFERGPTLTRTLGPLYGVHAEGFELGFSLGPHGERLLWLTPDEGEPQVRVFDAAGIPQLYEGALEDLPPPDAPRSRGNLDGQGAAERVERFTGA